MQSPRYSLGQSKTTYINFNRVGKGNIRAELWLNPGVGRLFGGVMAESGGKRIMKKVPTMTG